MSNIISLEFQALEVFSLAIHNNDIPLIDEIVIKNDSDYNLKNLEVEVSSSPSFFAPFSVKIAELFSGRYTIVSNHDIDIDVTKIMYSSQPINADINVRVKNMGEILAYTSKTVLLLPYDNISSVNVYPEVLSSFVTPNQEEIVKLCSVIPDKLKSNPNVPVNSDMWNFNDKTTVSAVIKANRRRHLLER